VRELPDAALQDQMMKAAAAEAREVQIELFVAESNRIEQIEREPLPEEIEAHRQFLYLSEITVERLERFVAVVEPRARLRRRKGQNVTVQERGKVLHRPQEGGPVIEVRLNQILEGIEEGRLSPAQAHYAYETLHPFTDGNGRSGRVLWAWHMEKIGKDPFSLAFLHRWYYESLEALRQR
jgi:hypothetical protein